jgi:hypothetical protein
LVSFFGVTAGDGFVAASDAFFLASSSMSAFIVSLPSGLGAGASEAMADVALNKAAKTRRVFMLLL